MKCKKAKILLSVSMDGELSKREAVALERHLSACEACARDEAQFAEVREVMGLWADEEPSAWLAESFAYKLGDLKREPRRLRPRRWALGTATAGAGISGAG